MRVKAPLTAVVLALATGLVLAQAAAGADDFKEIEAPAPPAYHKEGLIAIEMPSSVSLKYGVDPDTLSVGSDGVVRYVMVAYNPSGSVNALYEGLRCETGEVKTYARSSALGHWTMVEQPTWRLVDMSSSTRHALALTNQGVCEGRNLAASKASELIRLLRTPKRNLITY
jgi:hypothetical protein